EAASVDAFLILRNELVLHDAPKRLVASAGRAARDEVRHARMTSSMARRHGAMPKPVPASAGRTDRTLEEIAIENAIEGCVRETYGAVTAMWQASKAEDPRVRALMKRIAVDETRHAELAWSVAKWAHGRLSEESRARVDEAMRSAVHALAKEVSPPGVELTRSAGLPSVAEARSLLGGMRDVLWS
ncbi:MAG: ferritin-like domain-containing protein, partial [Polyangiaceae bacterium]